MTKDIKPKFLGAVSLAVSAGILAAGLWPFDFSPANKVEWLRNRNGIFFDGQGIICSADPFSIENPNSDLTRHDSMSLEIWLRSREESHNSVAFLLSLYQQKESRNFMLGQWGSELILRGRVRTQDGRVVFRELALASAFPKGQARFVTITSSAAGTAFYLDGALKEFVPLRTLIAKNLSGRLVLGDSPTGDGPWSGDLFGLAIYDRSLTEAKVNQHYRSRVSGRFSDLANEEGMIALYPFNERAGNRLRNHARLQPDLEIPQYYHVLEKTVLIPHWKDFRLNRSHLEDIVLNTIGFIPFGFFNCAFICNATRYSRRRASVITVLSGGSISLMIELVQVYLPTRTSSLTDLITNILGSALGVGLYRLDLFSPLRMTKSDDHL